MLLLCDELANLLVVCFLDYLIVYGAGHHLILIDLIALMPLCGTLILIEAAALQAFLHTLPDVAALSDYGCCVTCLVIGRTGDQEGTLNTTSA